MNARVRCAKSLASADTLPAGTASAAAIRDVVVRFRRGGELLGKLGPIRDLQLDVMRVVDGDLEWETARQRREPFVEMLEEYRAGELQPADPGAVEHDLAIRV